MKHTLTVCEDHPRQIKCGDDVIAVVEPSLYEEGEAEAYAILFAAAPDLLEACEALEWLGPQTADGYYTCQICHASTMFMKHEPDCIVGKAIAKAKGE
jgi:hypothetical protein